MSYRFMMDSANQYFTFLVKSDDKIVQTAGYVGLAKAKNLKNTNHNEPLPYLRKAIAIEKKSHFQLEAYDRIVWYLKTVEEQVKTMEEVLKKYPNDKKTGDVIETAATKIGCELYDRQVFEKYIKIVMDKYPESYSKDAHQFVIEALERKGK